LTKKIKEYEKSRKNKDALDSPRNKKLNDLEEGLLKNK